MKGLINAAFVYKPFQKILFSIKIHSTYLKMSCSIAGERPYKCSLCPKAFADKSNLRAHTQTHSNAKPFECRHCGKTFALKSYLYKHEEASCSNSTSNIITKSWHLFWLSMLFCIEIPRNTSLSLETDYLIGCTDWARGLSARIGRAYWTRSLGAPNLFIILSLSERSKQKF